MAIARFGCYVPQTTTMKVHVGYFGYNMELHKYPFQNFMQQLNVFA